MDVTCIVHCSTSTGTIDLASLYTQHGCPSFDLYDEGKSDIKGSDVLAEVKTVKEIDENKGFGSQQDDSTVDVAPGQVKMIKEKARVNDGNW